jgi:hypothetical protein
MVLISIGFIFLVDATIVLWEYQRDRQPEEHEHAGLLSRFLKYVPALLFFFRTLRAEVDCKLLVC